MNELPTFEVMRLAMLLLFLAAFGLYAWNIGRMWAVRSGGSRLLSGGLLAVLGYVTIGQIKAAAYGVPVDWITYVGAASAAVVIVALVLLQLGGHKHEGA